MPSSCHASAFRTLSSTSSLARHLSMRFNSCILCRASAPLASCPLQRPLMSASTDAHSAPKDSRSPQRASSFNMTGSVLSIEGMLPLSRSNSFKVVNALVGAVIATARTPASMASVDRAMSVMRACTLHAVLKLARVRSCSCQQTGSKARQTFKFAENSCASQLSYARKLGLASVTIKE